MIQKKIIFTEPHVDVVIQTFHSKHFVFSVCGSVKSFNRALPDLIDKLVQVEVLGGKMSPRANRTESIRRIKDIIEETRSIVNRVKICL